MDDVLDGPAEPALTVAEYEEGIAEANRVLGTDDPDKCTYQLGYRPRQALFACLTCSKDESAGFCTACAIHCHDDHEVVELWTKRNFRCDCGNSKFGSKQCQLEPDKDLLNSENQYNQNFRGLYCVCHRPFPDPERENKGEEEADMTQCVVCEDWFHDEHLGETLDDFDFEELICRDCYSSKCRFLALYAPILSQAADATQNPAAGLAPSDPGTVAASLASSEAPAQGSADAGTKAGSAECKLTGIKNGRSLAEAANALTDDDLSTAAEKIRVREVGPPSQEEGHTDNGPSTSEQLPGGEEGGTTASPASAVESQPLDPGTGEPRSEARVEGATADGASSEFLIPAGATSARAPASDSSGADVSGAAGGMQGSSNGRMLPLLLPSGWRSLLCACTDCSSQYEDQGVAFLCSEADTIEAYEAAGEKRAREVEAEEEENLKRKWQSLDHVGQIEFMHGVQDFKQSLSQFLTNHGSEKVLSADDVRTFFDELKKKRSRRG